MYVNIQVQVKRSIYFLSFVDKVPTLLDHCTFKYLTRHLKKPLHSVPPEVDLHNDILPHGSAEHRLVPLQQLKDACIESAIFLLLVR